MEEIVKIDNQLTSIEDDTEVLYEKVLSINSTTPNVDFKGIINQVCQYTNILDVVNNIKKGTEFVVQIPTEFQAGFEAGQYWIMENSKTGKQWPTLMQLGEDGRNHIVTPLPVKEREFIQGNPARDIAENYHNMYMQQQMTELLDVVENTYKVAERIEHGQMDDRIGMLEAGRQGIILALAQKDDASRIQNLSNAINNLNIAQSQIAETFKRRVNEFEALPKSKVSQFFIELAKTGYFDKKADEYDESQDYFSLYLDATKMLAGAYAITGDTETAKKVFELAIGKIQDIDYSNLKTIEYMYPVEEKIYEKAMEYLETEQNICLEDAKIYDCLSIKVTREEFLEVLNDVREQEISEEET